MAPSPASRALEHTATHSAGRLPIGWMTGRSILSILSVVLATLFATLVSGIYFGSASLGAPLMILGSNAWILARDATEEDVRQLATIPTTAGSYIPGELPYTAKSVRIPQGALAMCIGAVGEKPSRAETNREAWFSVRIDPTCARLQGFNFTENTETFFYIRLVGPAIVPGYSERVNRTTYKLYYEAYDPGIYSMQVAVDFAAALREGDPDFFEQDTHFEGREIRGSPFTVAVTGPSRLSSITNLTLCEGEAVGGPRGRWVLESPPGPLDSRGTRATRVEFLDAVYTWQPLDCRLPTRNCMTGSILKRCYGEAKFKLVVMGDSLMLLQLIDLIKQNDLAGPGGNGIELDWVNLDGGLAINMAKINASIEAAARYCDSTGGAAAIWFNSGLHDVDKYCSSIWTGWRAENNVTMEHGCLAQYDHYIRQLIAKVDESRFAGPKIFRMTTSSWMRFGNQRIQWESPNIGVQIFVNSRYTVAAFNKLAVPLFEAAGWSIVDGYATTTTRPDAAELRPRGRVGAAFVHFDPDVVSTLHNRQMMAAGLLQSCPTIVNEECQ